MNKLRKEDEVIVIAGKDKGKRGKILQVLDNGKVLVSGVNVVKRHTKPNPYANKPGGIVEKEAPIQISNVAIFNAETGKADRVGIREEDGKNVRFYKKTQNTISG